MANWKKIIEDKKDKGIRVISCLEQVENLRPFILKKSTKGFWIYNLTFTEKGNTSISTLMVTPNRQVNFLPPILEEERVVTANGFSDIKPYFSYALLNVEVEGEKSLSRLDKEIFMKKNGKNTIFFQENDEEQFINLVTGEEIDISLIADEDGCLLNDIIVFNDKDVGAQTCSPGQLKKGNITLPACNLDDFDAYDVWNKVSYGAADILCNLGTSISNKDIAQGNTRLSAYKAPSAAIGNVGNFAVYMGKIKFEGWQCNKGQYSYENTDDEYKDGFSFVSSEYLAKIFSALDPERYWFTPWSCDGLGIQFRPFTVKALAECVKRCYIDEFIAHRNLSTVILIRNQITKTQQEVFTKGVLSKGKAGKYAGKVVILVDSPEQATYIDVFTDLNGLKAPYDITQQSDLHILEMTHTEHDIKHGSNLSTQLIQSMMIVDPNKTELTVNKHAKRMIESRRNTLLSQTGRAPSIMDFERSDYMRMCENIAPEFSSQIYAPLWHSTVDNNIKGFVTAVKKLNLTTEGFYAKIVMDTAADFGHRILGPQKDGTWTVVAPNASANGIDRLVFVKYPKMHHREYMVAKVISPDKYCELVDNTNMTDYQKKIVKDHVKHLSAGLVMFASQKLLKNQLAGLDIDGDAAQAFANADIVDLLEKHKTVAIVIDENDVAKEKDLVQELVA